MAGTCRSCRTSLTSHPSGILLASRGFKSSQCSESDPRSSVPHLRRSWLAPSEICARTAPPVPPSPARASSPARPPPPPSSPQPTSTLYPSALGFDLARLHSTSPHRLRLGSPLPHIPRDWAHPDHVCAGTRCAPSTSAPGLGLTPTTSAPGLAQPVCTLRRPHRNSSTSIATWVRPPARAINRVECTSAQLSNSMRGTLNA
jgi:hypothetical protein